MSDNAEQVVADNGRAASLANLRPFPKGVSGNPSGRRDSDIVLMLSPHVPTAVKAIVRNLDDPKHSLRAAEILLDRVYGKPVQAVTATDAATTITFLHLVAARAFSEQMQAGNVPVIEGNTDVSTDTNVATPDLMQPATE